MKAAYILSFLLLFSPFLKAQDTVKTVKADTIIPAKGNVDKQLDKIDRLCNSKRNFI